MKKILAVIALVLLIFACLYLLGGATKNQAVLVVIIIASVVGIVKVVRGKGKKKAKQASAEVPNEVKTPVPQPDAAAPVKKVTPAVPAVSVEIETPVMQKMLKCTLAGVTFHGRQNYLRKISEYEEPFVGCMFDVNKTTYEGNLAFEVVAMLDDGTKKVLGFIRQRDIPKVEKIYDAISGVDVDVYGGPEYEDDDKSYGASVEIRYN